MEKIKKNLTSMIFHFLTFLVTLALIIGIDVWKFEFDWELISLEYMSMRMLISIGFVLIKISVSNFTYDTKEVTDDNYVDTMKQLGEASKKNRGYTFNDKIGRLDYQNKKETWIRQKEKELFKHQRNIPKKVATDIRDNDESMYKRRTKRWIRRTDTLEMYLSEEWMEKNLIIQDIKYPEILPQEVLYGTMEFQPEKSYLDRAPLKRIIVRSLPKAIFSLVGTTLLGALVSVNAGTGIGLFVSLMSLIVILVVNITIGVMNGVKGHKSRVNNANKRSEIMINYKEGVYDELPEVPKRFPSNMKYNTQKEKEADTVEPKASEEVIEESKVKDTPKKPKNVLDK